MNIKNVNQTIYNFFKVGTLKKFLKQENGLLFILFSHHILSFSRHVANGYWVFSNLEKEV